jgi:hypothetical protein
MRNTHRPSTYPQVVGSVLYGSTISPPNLAEAAGDLSRFISKWNKSHRKAAKDLLGYADANWGGDMDTQRSTTGYVVKVYGGVIVSRSYVDQQGTRSVRLLRVARIV